MRESEFFLWLAISQEEDKDTLLRRSAATSFAVWKPGKLKEIFGEKPEPMSEEEAYEALQKAEEIKKLDFKETT